MKRVSWFVWGLCLSVWGLSADVWAAPKPRHKAFVVTRSVEGRTSASVLKRARQRVLHAARQRCGKIGLRMAGTWKQRCKSKGRRISCTAKRRFACGPSKQRMVAKRKARKRPSLGKRARKAVRRNFRRLAKRLRRRGPKKSLRVRKSLARRGMCSRTAPVRGVSRSRGKHLAQKQARAAAYRRAARQCKRQRVVWMAAWNYRCRSAGKGRVVCAAQNKARCCGGRVVARAERRGKKSRKSRKSRLRRKKRRGRRVARRVTKKTDVGFEP